MKSGAQIDPSDLLRKLVELQYRRNDGNFHRGTFRVRGDTIEIFPAHYEDRAWRISLFGDEVEAIHEFDPLTGDKAGELETVRVYANSHYVTPKPTLQQAVIGIRQGSGVGGREQDPRGTASRPTHYLRSRNDREHWLLRRHRELFPLFNRSQSGRTAADLDRVCSRSCIDDYR